MERKKGQKAAKFRFQGTCNLCGGWGHRQAECDCGGNAQVESESIAVGSIRNIGFVQCADAKPIPGRSRFAPLAVGCAGGWKSVGRVGSHRVPDP